jgi:N-succinyl-L-ornithine transcarbamylase
MLSLGNYIEYGQITNSDPNWTVTADKMKLTNDAKFILFTRKDWLIVSDEVID